MTVEERVEVGSAGEPAPVRRSLLSRQVVADLSLLLVTAIWGTTFVIVKEAVAVVPPLTFIALRFTLATVAMAALFGRRLRGFGWREYAAGALIGVFLFAGFVLQTLGLQLTSASTAGFITGLSVVLVPFVGYFALGQRPGTGALVGVAAATVGLALLSLGDDLSLGPGDALVLGCAVAFALHIVAVGRFAPRIDALALTLVQLAVVCALSWPSALALERPTVPMTLEFWLVLVFVGVVATGLVFAIQNAAQRFTSPTHTALIFTMEPVFAALFARLWLAEELGPRAAVGAVLILGGMLAADLLPDRKGSTDGRP